MHEYCVWNLHAEGRVATFQVTVPGWPTVPLVREGPWLADCLASSGAHAAGPARITAARWCYSGDYPDSADWADRWQPVSYVEVDLSRDAVFRQEGDVAFARHEGNVFAEGAVEAYLGDDVSADHDSHALLVVDCPGHATLSAAELEALGAHGTLAVQARETPLHWQKRTITKILALRRARFPADVGSLEATLKNLPRGLSTDWHRTSFFCNA